MSTNSQRLAENRENGLKAFPTDRDEKHRVLMDAVASVRNILEAGAQEGEETATLPQASVDALYDSGLLRLKLPHALGGAEADLVTQLDVLEAVSEIEPSAGWCLMIGAASLGGVGAFLPDDAIDVIFPDGIPPRTAGVFAPFGTAVPTDGGYLLTGQWSFASGVRHSQWISAGARVKTEKPGHPAQVRATMPTSDISIHDNWHVMGLRGTGSCDFSAKDLFVPASFAYDVSLTEPLRGGGLYRLGRPGFVTNEHAAFALGVGRRALNTVLDVGQSKTRGYTSVNPLAQRPVFQRMLSECDLKLRAARALNVEVLEEAWEVVCDGRTPEPSLQARLRGCATFATDVAVDVVTQAFRFAGGAALFESSILQRCLRDINAGAQHQMVSDASYENHGQFMLGLPGARPLE